MRSQIREVPSLLIGALGAFAGFCLLTILRIRNVIDADAYIGGIASVMIAFAAARFALFAYEQWLWRLWPLRHMLPVPNFRGLWIGWYYDTQERQWCRTWHNIDQKGARFEALTAEGGPSESAPSRHNASKFYAAAIYRDGQGHGHLHWSYDCKREDENIELAGARDPETGSSHEGVHMMTIHELDGHVYMTGEYANNRERAKPSRDGRKQFGTRGLIVMRRISTDPSMEPPVDNRDWPMRMPQRAPGLMPMLDVAREDATRLGRPKKH